MSLLHVYACGGTGINIAAALTKFESKPGYADLKVTYSDTSDSDLNHLKPNPKQKFLSYLSIQMTELENLSRLKTKLYQSLFDLWVTCEYLGFHKI